MEFAANESRGTQGRADVFGDAKEATSAQERRVDEHAPTSVHAVSTLGCGSKGTAKLEPFGLVAANAGDHTLIHALLRTVYQAPSYEDFVTWLDDPTYEPLDRLLLKHRGGIVAHVQVLDRLAWFHGIRLPVGGIQDLAILPEYRGAAQERQLLAAAEETLRERQAVVAFARSDRAGLFSAAGWSEVHGARATEANVHDVLALLTSRGSGIRRRPRSLQVRRWRHVELDALRPVYLECAQTAWGAIDRSESYWRWLVGRKAHDDLIVAVQGHDDWEQLDQPPNIVGYAAVQGATVVELCCRQGFAHAGKQLLARACRDAIEHDHRTLELRLPASAPLHQLMLAAGGQWKDGSRTSGGTTFVKLLDPARWIESTYPLLLERAKAVGISRPFHLAFRTDNETQRMELTRRSGKLDVNSEGTPDVQCAESVLGALLVGNLDIDSAHEAKQLIVSDDATARKLPALFPPEEFWLSPFDLLRL